MLFLFLVLSSSFPSSLSSSSFFGDVSGAEDSASLLERHIPLVSVVLGGLRQRRRERFFELLRGQ